MQRNIGWPPTNERSLSTCCVPDTVLHMNYLIQFSQLLCEVGPIIIPILQMRKLIVRDIK